MFETIVTWLTDTIFVLGYPGVIVLMAIESSFFPFPSEVVLPPAGYLAAQGRMNIWFVMGAGLLGSLLGALFNYYVAMAVGRPFLHRWGKYFFVREGPLTKAEEFFRRHGEISTFVGRLIPVIRQLISVPAGLSRMHLGRFLGYTALGAGIWCVILTLVGWYVGQNAGLVTDVDALMADPRVHRITATVGLALLPLLALVVVVYVRRVRRRSPPPTGA